MEVNDEVKKDAVWYFLDPKPATSEIKGWVAFWKVVKAEK
ncbi:MAG: DUF427 domain-containing protein [Cyclobacteriaceae bacterium]|nr:DUF427 domain-containing protein [Cyclobacteriaceae bacterium]